METIKRQNIFAQWLSWHFIEMPGFLVSVWKNYMVFGLEFFSVVALFSTLFSPWRKYNWRYPKGFSFTEYASTFVSNIFSRIIGAICRLVLIVIGIVAQIFILFAGLLVIASWILIPLLILALVFDIALSRFSPGPVFLVSFFVLVFFELYLFARAKIYNPANGRPFLTEFVSLPLHKIIKQAVKKSKAKKMPDIGSEMLFYAAVRYNKNAQALLERLGIDVTKTLIELNNHLEKQRTKKVNQLSFSADFKAVIVEAAAVTVARGNGVIGEKELLMGLAKFDVSFKKMLVDNDLKEKDVENLTAWLGAKEQEWEKAGQFWSLENLSRWGSLGKDFASGFTVTLDRYSADWQKAAKKNRFGQIIGHKKEVDELEVVLVKSELSNALLVGEEGVGRKSIVEELARRCYLKTGMTELAGKRVVELNMVALCAQIQDPEKVEATLDQIFQEALQAGNVILVIDQLDNFVLQSPPKAGAVDISVILGKYLAMPSFQFIGITSFDGLRRNLEQSSSFLEYFRKIEVSEISDMETIMILQNLALALEKKYKILITYPAIREIINLTGRYFPSTPFPKKAIDVLQEAAIYVGTLKDVARGRRQSKLVLPSHIAKIVSEKAKIPMGKMEFKEKSVLLDLEHLIHQRIVGQEEAVSEISIAMRRARSGLGSKKRPMGVFLFLGPTGVGKTETAKALAQIYFGSEEKMIRLDMSEFQAISDIPRLIGQVSPVEEQGLLTTPVRENPFSLVLLDEVEKAHPNILNLFLQVFDEGHITDGQGRRVMFSNTIIICTSNAGAQMIFQNVESGKKLGKSKLFDFLFEKAIFRPEFINRFDAAVFFNPLTRDNLLKIAELNLQSLAKNLKEKDIDFVITEALKEKIVKLSYKPEFGAREMRRVMQDKVENSVAQALLSDKIVKGDVIHINPEDFSVVKEIVN